MKMLNIVITICLSSFLVLGCVATKTKISKQDEKISNNGVGDSEVLDILSAVRKKYKIPAMAAVVLNSHGVQRIAAVGTRKSGTDVPVTLVDNWHLGSNTKIMTSMLVAKLVEQGKLTWASTISDVFPDLDDGFSPEAKDITVLQLLSHVAGLPANIDYDLIKSTNSVREQRIEAVRIGLNGPLLSIPGTKFLYSNIGYIIIGAMIERVLDMDWESAINQHIFIPLKMSSAGFGGLGTPGKIDQPWGHLKINKPFNSNGPDVDNPPVLGPAGRVHCTIQDWALFIADQLRGARGEPAFLAHESYQMLQSTHFDGYYALGWGVLNKDRIEGEGKEMLRLSGESVLFHNGSNTFYFAMAWVAPAKDFAILICTNMGEKSDNAASLAVSKLILLVNSN